jgi:hypothetical protein
MDYRFEDRKMIDESRGDVGDQKIGLDNLF